MVVSKIIRPVSLRILEIDRKKRAESDGELLMQVLHGGRAENNEESHPECGSLERDHFVGFSVFFIVIRFENHRIEEKRHQAKDQEEFDEKDHKILCMMLHARAGL